MTQLEAIQDFICFNQKNIIKYEYLISQLHKDLKNYFNDNQEDEDFEKKLNLKYEKLIIESYTRLIDMLDMNKPLIRNIFKSISSGFPRISIKSIDNDYVLDLYRDGDENDFRLTKVQDNTAFNEILNNNQKYYIANNLEELFLQGKYENSRLNKEQRDELADGKIDWINCWKPYTNTTKNVKYYNSTLVIPMAIRSDNLDKKDKEFYEKFFKNVSHHKNSRTVWGFLCLDHKSSNFFEDEETMKLTGYIIADILSLYLMFFYNYISASDTINKVFKKISEIE